MRGGGDDLGEVLARATSPEERLAGGWTTAVPDAPGRERADRWHARVGRGDERRSASVLESRGLTRDDLVRSLSAARPVAGGDLPAWATAVVELHSRCRAPGRDFPWAVPTLADIAGPVLPAGVDGRSPWRFHDGFRAWLGAAAEDVASWVEQSGAPVADPARRDLVLDLARRMLAVVGPTLVAVAGAAPVFHADVPGRWLALWGAQPVTARLMAVAWLQWSAATRALVSATAADLPALAPRRTVVGVDCDAGDRHGDGRTVVAVRLDDGTRLFHKPRDVGPARTLATWLAAVAVDGHPLRLPVVHARAGYAWVEEVRRGECADRAAVAAYYRRAGALLRVLQVLGATDLHHENFVPTADQPVLVDLETAVGHGSWRRPGGGAAADPCDRDLAAALAEGVAATSMVTSPVDGQPGLRSVDLGAMAGPDTRPTPYPVLAPTPSGAGLAMSPQRPALPNGQALPVLHGVPVGVAAFAADVVAGYRDAAERLARLAETADGMPAVAGDESVRFVARPTRVYVRLLQDSLSPAALADGAERELVLERLWLAADSCPPAVIAAEQAALRRLDVPVFSAPLRGRDLLADDGTRIAAALDEAAATIVRRRWDRMVAGGSTAEAVDDLRAALFAVADAPAPPAAPTTTAATTTTATTTSAAATAARATAAPTARRPADLDDALEVLLAQARVCGEGAVAWLGLELDAGRQRWRPGRLGPGLLGEAGVGLALAARTALAPGAPPRCAALARATLLTAAARARSVGPGRCADAFGGPAGTLYAVARAAALLDDSALTAAATALLPAALAAAAADPPTRLLDPVAGAVCACWHLPASAGRDDALARLADLLAASTGGGHDGTDPLTSPWSQGLPGRSAGRALARRRLGLPETGTAWAAAAPPATAGDRIAAAALGGPVPVAPGRADPGASEGTPTAHDWLDLAEQARAAGPQSQAQGQSQAQAVQALAAQRIAAGRRRSGTWFPDVLAPDSRNLSAVHGMAAVVLLGVGHHADAPTVRVLS